MIDFESKEEMEGFGDDLKGVFKDAGFQEITLSTTFQGRSSFPSNSITDEWSGTSRQTLEISMKGVYQANKAPSLDNIEHWQNELARKEKQLAKIQKRVDEIRQIIESNKTH